MDELYLVRHGETQGESAVRLYGRTDIALSGAGREQMRRVGSALKGVAFDAVYASPMQRSLESAQIVMLGRTPQPQCREEFREIDFGEWEGWRLKDAEQRAPEIFQEWKTAGVEFQFPGGDRKREFFERVAAAAADIFNAAGGRALAVLHKGVIKGTLAGLLARPVEDFTHHRIELGSIHILRRAAGRWTLEAGNLTDHLGDSRIPESG